VAHQPDQVVVDVRRWSAPGAPLPDMPIEAWVLTSNGSALSRSRPEQKVLTWGRRTEAGTGTTWRSIFPFAPADQRDLAAVVVSLEAPCSSGRFLRSQSTDFTRRVCAGPTPLLRLPFEQVHPLPPPESADARFPILPFGAAVS
jgi:hypothetical protein